VRTKKIEHAGRIASIHIAGARATTVLEFDTEGAYSYYEHTNCYLQAYSATAMQATTAPENLMVEIESLFDAEAEQA
jgi:uncharacterized Fe-S cluster-containing MiaB family protein